MSTACLPPAVSLRITPAGSAHAPPSSFLPIKVLSRVFRGKFVAGLKTAFREGTLQFHGTLALLREPRTFTSWLRSRCVLGQLGQNLTSKR